MADNKETQLAVDLQAEILALVKKYESHEHLTSFTSDLENIAEEIDACLEDVEGVE